ncbi:SRPBCC family protein [Mycolicibacterium rhodesiae]|uniref:MxaD family protein n=1 Tax=Mycolicibacterium rhodesiae TaxID=36814 RepID=A0A1X0J1B7_MYCRH|nr:SRPBCC family protein [Mycolicibacterium rhodesiae]ORB55680.1 MxaD family protein [Mycolicibacterium rhodesiae]
MRLNDPVADIRRSRAIAADPQKIWDVLADFGAISSWADVIDHSCLLDHGAAGGTVGTSRRVQLGRTTLVERITDFDPPHTLAYDVEGLPPLVRRLHNSWTLRPIARGLTEVTLTSAVTVGSNPLQRIAERVFVRVSATRLDRLLACLARELEGHCV